MKALAVTIVAILLAGCASTRPQPDDGEQCDRVANLVGDGEFKPAVDELTALEGEGSVCPDSVLVAVEGARARLAEADALVLSAQGRRQNGDLSGASSDLQKALEVYPKYYWAEKQLRDVQRTLSADPTDARVRLQRRFDAKLSQARAAEARGDLVEASRLTLELFDNVPADSESRSDLVEYSRLLGLKLFSESELTQARDLWQRALVLDPSNQKILDYLQEVDQRLRSLEEIKSKDEG